MKQKNKMVFALLSCLLFCSGCALLQDDSEKEEPVTTPYTVPARKSSSAGKNPGDAVQATLINDAVSSISLKMALSGKGPFKILCAKKPSSTGEKILQGLYLMGQIVPSAKDILYYSETASGGNISIRLGIVLNGSDFYTLTIPVQEKRKNE